MVQAHDEEQETHSHGLGLRRLSHAQEPQGWQASQTETAVRRLAREGFADGDSRAVPQAVRHRDQLSPTPASADLYLHAPAPTAAAVHRRGADLAQPVGLDPSRALGRRRPKQPNAPSRTTPLQTHARLDRPPNHHANA